MALTYQLCLKLMHSSATVSVLVNNVSDNFLPYFCV